MSIYSKVRDFIAQTFPRVYHAVRHSLRHNAWVHRVVVVVGSLGALAVVFMVPYVAYALKSSFETITVSKEPSFRGIVASLADSSDKNIRLLVVHGIGEHCIGYSVPMLRGILKNLDMPLGPGVNRRIDAVREAVSPVVDEFLEEHQRLAAASGSGSRLDALEAIIKASRSRLPPPPPKDPSEGALPAGHPPSLADPVVARATELLAYLKYGFADNNCQQVRFEESVDLQDYNAIDNSRINTCQALSDRRIAAYEEERIQPEVDCHRLTLDFYDRTHVEEFIQTDSEPDHPPLPKCPLGTGPLDDGCVRTEDYDLAFLTTWTYPLGSAGSDPARYLMVYELTWDPATRWAKMAYTGDDGLFERHFLNGWLKDDVVNDRLADAVMYLGTYRPLIQFPLFVAFCKILTDPPPGVLAQIPQASDSEDDEFRCSRVAGQRFSAKKFADRNELAIITHSLGTRMLFDTLGLLAQDDVVDQVGKELIRRYVYFTSDELDAIGHSAEEMKKAFMLSLTKIYVLTNQVPLLELSRLSRPYPQPAIGDRDLGIGFNQFMEERRGLVEGLPEAGGIPPLQIVAFTDPNDLLSYNLRCWYQRHIMRWSKEMKERINLTSAAGMLYLEAIESCPFQAEEEWVVRAYEEIWADIEKYMKISDVSLDIQGWKAPGIFAEPGGVHSNYFSDPSVHELIACGSEAEDC